jgi:hypothetical protein
MYIWLTLNISVCLMLQILHGIANLWIQNLDLVTFIIEFLEDWHKRFRDEAPGK